MTEPHPLRSLLDATPDVAPRWHVLQEWVQERFGREPSMESILFLIGIQSRGRGFEPELEKDNKQALIMEGTYCVFATLGIYEPAGMERDGSWVWERKMDMPTGLSVDEQETLLQIAVLRYFDELELVIE